MRPALRRLRGEPGFTATALLTLALCLGANLTLFAVVDSTLLRPLPFPDDERLVSVYNTYPKANVPHDGCSLTNYYERRGRIEAFATLAAYREGTAVVGETGATERVDIVRVTPDFFATLGLGPAFGRAFTEAETRYETAGVAILTDAYWRAHFGGDPGVLGRRIRVDGGEKEIVGVLPPAFRFLSSAASLYFPLASDPEEHGPSQRHSGSSDMIGRLRPRVHLVEAQAQIDAHNASVEADNPQAPMMAQAGFRSLVVPLRADHVAGLRPTLLLLQSGALFLLLMGAVNLVNLLLMRASGRVKELATRQALGAKRGHVVSEVMTETLLLALGGGLLGLAVGAMGVRLVAALGADRLPLGAHVAFDSRIAAVGLVAALVLGVAMGLPIAWYNLRTRLAPALHSESRGGTAARGAQRVRHGFVVAQIAAAFVLLTGAGLLTLGLHRAMTVSPGFRPAGITTGRLSLPWERYGQAAARSSFTETLLQEIARRPGVVAAGLATNVPFSGRSNKSAATVIGHTLAPGQSPQGHYAYSVGGDYFTALGYSLREGRFLEPADSARAARVCVVDEDFARRYWPQGRRLGQRLFDGGQAGAQAEAYTVVGVVAPVKQAELTEAPGQGAVYYPFGHRPDGEIFVVARTRVAGESLGSVLPELVRRIDPELPVTDVRSMEARIDESLVARRSPALLASLFSGIALLLTAVGTYGVASYAVALRRREIGVRMALGARPAQIRRQFLFLGLRLLAIGTGLGAIAAWNVGLAMQRVLFDLPALSRAALLAVGLVIGAVTMVACLVPSRRAARVSPMEALAQE